MDLVTEDAATDDTIDDPVLVRRARIAKLVDLGRRLGYSLLLVAVVAFFVGAFRGFTRFITVVVTAALLLMSLFLAPAIVFGYAVKAAEREDREQGRPTRVRGNDSLQGECDK